MHIVGTLLPAPETDQSTLWADIRIGNAQFGHRENAGHMISERVAGGIFWGAYSVKGRITNSRSIMRACGTVSRSVWMT